MAEAVYRNGFPAYRVFIFGQEITKDVTSVVIKNQDGRAPNTASITVNSPFDRYIITLADLLQIKGYTTASQSVPLVGHASPAMVLTPNDSLALEAATPRANVFIADAIKRNVVQAKLPVHLNVPGAGEFVTGSGGEITSAVDTAEAGSADRYPFQCGKPIFHPMDAVRVFFRDPFTYKWYHMFSGFVSDFIDDVGANNDNILTIVAEDPTKLLRYARFTANPGLVDISQQVVQDAITKDVATRTVFANLFNGKTLPEIFHSLIFGAGALSTAADNTESGDGETVTQTDYSVNGSAKLITRKYGTGRFNLQRSIIYEYGAGENDGDDLPAGMNHDTIDSLAAYQAVLDHEVRSSDLSDMLAENITEADFLDIPENPGVDDVVKAIGEHPELYPVDGGRLIMLIPKSLGAANREIVTRELVGSFNLNTEWSTRAQVLYDVVERIQFVFYCSPKGDLCVEFPLFDFMPVDFGDMPVTTSASSNFANDSRGPFGPNYIIGEADTTHVSAAFTDSKVITQMSATSLIAQNWENSIPEDIAQKLGRIVTVTLRQLIPLYGVRSAPVTSKGYIATARGAELYAHISLSRINADAYTQHVNMMPRFTSWINRPHYIQTRNHIGTTKSITHAIVWGQECMSDLGLHMMRGWDGQIDENGRMIFNTIGGATSRPFDYARLWGKNVAQQAGVIPDASLGVQA